MFIFQVFSDEEVAALVKYIITMSKLFHGLTKMQTKQLAYKFAKNKNIKIPQNWIVMKLLEKIGSKDLEKEKLASYYGNLSQLAWPEQQHLIGKMWKSFFTIYEKFILEETIFVLTIYLT